MKTAYKHIIFDLDGTLSDSREGIFNAFYYTFDKLGITYPEQEKLKALIGPPLQKGFTDLFGLYGEANANAVKVFREYYGDKGLFENTLYDGIKELLESLLQGGAFLLCSHLKIYSLRQSGSQLFWNCLLFYRCSRSRLCRLSRCKN